MVLKNFMHLNIFSRGIEHYELFNKIFNILQQNTLLLIQDGVYCGLKLQETTISNYTTNNIYALEQDVIGRGLASNYPKYIKLINYNDFVNLVLHHEKTITY